MTTTEVPSGSFGRFLPDFSDNVGRMHALSLQSPTEGCGNVSYPNARLRSVAHSTEKS